MREINAKLMGQNADSSTRIAKRAVLLAVLVASTSSLSGQQPSGGMINSRFQNSASAPRIVRQGARIASTPGLGVMRSNPYIVPIQAENLPHNSVQLVSGDGLNVRLKSAKGAIGLTEIGQQYALPAAAADPQSGVAPMTGAIRQNSRFHAQRSAAVSAQPLIELGDEDYAPADRAEAFDRFGQDTANAFVQQRRQAQVLFPEIPEAKLSSANPVPLAIPDGSAAPLSLMESVELNDRASDPKLARIGVSTGEASLVVPVTDARESQDTIQETKPILFSLSDDQVAADDFVPTADAKSLEQKIQENLIALESNNKPESGKEATNPTDEVATDDKETAPLAVIDTPVKLAPVVNLAKEIVSLPQQIPAPPDGASDSQPVIRQNRMVSDSDEDYSDKDDADNDAEVDDLVIINRSRIPLAANEAIFETITDSVTELQRGPVAVATPPIRIKLSDSDDSVQPAINGIAIDPTKVSAKKELQDVSPNEFAVKALAIDSHATITSVTPIVENIGTGETPLIAAPVVTNPSHHAMQTTVPTVRRSDVKSGSSILALPVSSRLNLQRRPIDPAGKMIDHTVPDEQLSEGKSTDGQRRPVVLQLTHAQVRSMTIGGRLRRYTVADKDICQAFASGGNQLKLIGTGMGTTQLTIWADVTDGEPTRMQVFEIEVNDGVNAIGDKVAGHTELLNESIDKAFPTASVVVALRGGELVVTGRCDDEETARQIIRMVRKSCLVPVQDNLKVR